MFESAELGHTIDRKTYKEIVPALRADLLDAQYDVGQLKAFSVLILINGVEGSGRGETVNELAGWLDPRHVLTYAFGDPSDEEYERPYMWRFWRALPPKGKIGILFHNWNGGPIQARATKQIKLSELNQQVGEINRFEAMLAREGTLILKFWFHLSKDEQAQRFKLLAKDPSTRWRVTKADWENHKRYDKFRDVAEHVLRLTSTAHAPWIVVAGADPCYRTISVGRTVLEALRKRLDIEALGAKQLVSAAAPLPAKSDTVNLINTLKLDQTLTKKEFDRQLEKLQGSFAMLTRRPEFRERPMIVVFEGQDAAGKGGTIRRITGALDARQYRVVPIAAPTEEEKAQPYLWRFWRNVPRNGWVTIFDRSWYGRVLVERVEGFCSEADWMRAYAEINDYEDQLVRHGSILVKFWLAISAEEQLRRFKERETTRFKRFKITAEDWRNRERWQDYESAVCDMVDRTSTEIAPWTLVEADNKYYARIKVLRTLRDRLEQAMSN
jgi:polyphosphate:AMP phosphotransferase